MKTGIIRQITGAIQEENGVWCVSTLRSAAPRSASSRCSSARSPARFRVKLCPAHPPGSSTLRRPELFPEGYVAGGGAAAYLGLAGVLSRPHPRGSTGPADAYPRPQLSRRRYGHRRSVSGDLTADETSAAGGRRRFALATKPARVLLGRPKEPAPVFGLAAVRP